MLLFLRFIAAPDVWSQTFRIFFRCLFVVPLFILACDGLRPHQHVNENMFVPRLILPPLNCELIVRRAFL